MCSAVRCVRVSSFGAIPNKVQHFALVFASTERAGEFQDAFEEADRLNRVFLEYR